MSQQGARARFPRAPDSVLALVLFLLALGTLHMSPQGSDAWGLGGIALSAVLAAALARARTHPWTAMVVVTGAFLVAQSLYGLVPVFAIVVAVTVFCAASGDVTSRFWDFSAATVVAVAVDLSAELTHHDSWTNSAYLVMATAVLGAAAAGDAVRSRRAYVREVEARVQRVEYSREQTVQRRIAEERLTIARDVHDLVAHHLAVVSVQAEVANHLVGSQPALAKQAIGTVRDAAGSALAELGSLIGILRGGASAPLDPSPTLAQLPELTAAFEATGLQVSVREQGTVRPLPAAVDLAAYRLLQESLTNAHKHGSGNAEVHITYDVDRLVIDVVNPTASDDGVDAVPTRTGHGLTGMRERVAAVGGDVLIEQTPTQAHDRPRLFRVLATIPAGGPG